MKRKYALPAVFTTLAIIASFFSFQHAAQPAQAQTNMKMSPGQTWIRYHSLLTAQPQAGVVKFEVDESGVFTATSFVHPNYVSGTIVSQLFEMVPVIKDGKNYSRIPFNGVTMPAGWDGNSVGATSFVSTTVDWLDLVGGYPTQTVTFLGQFNFADLGDKAYAKLNDAISALDWVMEDVVVEPTATMTPKPTSTAIPTIVPTAQIPPTAVPTATPMPDYEINGLVWQDQNHDGKPQGSEPILSGLTMTLYTKVGESFTAVDTMTLQPVFSPGDVRNYYFHQTAQGRMKLGVNIPAEIFGLPCYASTGLDANGFSEEFEIKPDEKNQFVYTKNLAIVCERRTFLPVMVVS